MVSPVSQATGLLVTQLEPDFKYAIRVTSASINGIGYPSEPYYFWAGVLPTERFVFVEIASCKLLLVNFLSISMSAIRLFSRRNEVKVFCKVI